MKITEKIDLHMHSTVSDGTDTPREILSHAQECGLELFSLTDHDALRGCDAILEELSKEDGRETHPYFITGAEFSCKDDFGKYHILGYRYDPEAESIHSLVDKGRSFRMRKVRDRLSFLKDAFGFEFSSADLQELFSQYNPGKPHIGKLMVKYGYAATIEEAIQKYIDQKEFQNVYLNPQEAIEAVLKSRGIPVLAHPSYGSGDQIIVGLELKERIRRLMGFGLKGVEAFYSGFSPKLIRELLGFAQEFDLYITAGSDYHGKNKLVAIGETQLPGPKEWPEGFVRFIEDVI